jgi:hypothetical protein
VAGNPPREESEFTFCRIVTQRIVRITDALVIRPQAEMFEAICRRSGQKAKESAAETSEFQLAPSSAFQFWWFGCWTSLRSSTSSPSTSELKKFYSHLWREVMLTPPRRID